MNPSVNRSADSPQSPANPQQEPPEQTINRPLPPSQSNSGATSQEQITAQTSEVADTEPETPLDTSRQQPIPPPSEPLQYRAIGLVRGQYMPSVEQFTQGTLLATDHTLIDAVLLGRVMSLVKNHLNLAESHLWVVYPRTRKEDDKLHVQIVGVWEPERLNKTTPTETGEVPSTDETGTLGQTHPEKNSKVPDGYFSIRGEVIYQSREEQHLIAKIIQAPRKPSDKPKFFKLKLKGSLADKMVGHFWDFQVQRQGDDLVIQEGTDIAQLRAKKPKKSFKGKGQGGQKPRPPQRTGDRPATATPPRGDKPLPKPIKKQKPPN